MRQVVLYLGLAAVAGNAIAPRGDANPRERGAEQRAAAVAGLAATQFVPNAGQWDPAVRYAALGDASGWLHDDGYTLRLERWEARADGTAHSPRVQSGCVVRTRFLDAEQPTFVPGAMLPARRHFFTGSSAATWRSDVPGFDRVTMRGVQPGIDVVFRPLAAPRRGAFEYDLVLAPHADLSRFRARCEGVDELSIDAAGRLHAVVHGGDAARDLVQEAPIAWQESPAGRRAIEVAFRLLDEHTYGFVAPDLDPELATVVDPGVVWGTYLGGGLSDSVNALRWREGIGVWVAGWASSTDFPTTTGAYRTTGGADAFVARFDDAGQSLQFATYLGGSRAEEVRGLALGPGDTPTVVGYTQSNDFPVTPGALQPVYRGASPFLDVGDGFVTRLNATGSALLSSTYLGGVFDDVAEAVYVDVAGNATVAGWSSSPDFPTTPGVFQGAIAGVPGAQADGFVARVSASGQSLVFSTFVGSSLNDEFVAIDRDPTTGDNLVCGWTLGVDYPTTLNAARPASAGNVDAIVTRLAANGSSLVFSTYLGGQDADYGLCVRVAPDGTVWCGGTTLSANFPLSANAVQSAPGGDRDGFVTQLGANGQAIQYSTRLGGTGSDRVRGIDIATNGVVVVGEAGAGFPMTLDAVQPAFAGGVLDGFLTWLTNGGATIAYSTYLGGANQDVLGCVSLSASGVVVLGGFTFANDFPIAPAGYQSQLLGVEDGVVIKFDLVTTFGPSLTVEGAPSGAAEVVEAGEHELLAATLHNVTARDLVVDSVRVLFGGAGDARTRAVSLRVLREVAGVSAPQQIAGPFAIALDDGETVLGPLNCSVPGGDTVRLHLVAEVVPDPTGASAELVATIVGTSSWSLHAVGAGGGPSVSVAEPGRADGACLVLGAMPGDLDRDGACTVVDVRRGLAHLGASDLAADCDGDGHITAIDVDAVHEAVLGQPTVFAVPAAVPRDTWITLRGLFPVRAVQAALGGHVLTVGAVSPRELVLFVPADQAVGTQELVLSVAGRVVLATLVHVQ